MPRGFDNVSPLAQSFVSQGTQGSEAVYGGRDGSRLLGYQVPQQVQQQQAADAQTAAAKAAGPSGANTTWFGPSRTGGGQNGSGPTYNAGYYGDPNAGGGGFLNQMFSGVANGIGGAIEGVSDVVDTDEFRTAAQLAALAYGGYNLYNGLGTVGAAGAASPMSLDPMQMAQLAGNTGTGAGAFTLAADGVGSNVLFPETVGNIAQVNTMGGGTGLTLGAGGETGLTLGAGGQTGLVSEGVSGLGANSGWMSKLNGVVPGLSSAVSSVGTGLGYAKDAAQVYGLVNALGNTGNTENMAGQLEGYNDTLASNNDLIQQQINSINEQIGKIPTLESMYGQDSSYAKSLMKQLAAKDAAAGRNSQYGQRFENFQGTLADKASQYASQYASAVSGLNNSISSLYGNRTSAATAMAKNAEQAAKLREASLKTKGQAAGELFDMYQNSGISKALQSYFSG